MKTTKADLAKQIATTAGVSKAKGASALDAVLSLISSTLKKGGKTTVPGFGTFKVVMRKDRKGINPRTGKPITIKARRVVRFTAGKSLKELVK
jgi:DNA-binding protein HU-beta